MTERRIVALDGLRGMAILYVMLGHFGPSWLHAAGAFGVTLFFALSGRLMADVLFIGNLDWREFAVRRFARLYPALLFFLGCMSFVSWALGRQELLADWWCYPIFAVNLVVVLAQRFPAFDHLWSVSLEVQAYVVLAVIAVTLPGKWRLAALLAGFLFGTTNGLIRTYVNHQNPFLVYWRPDVGIAVMFGAAFLHLILQQIRLPRLTAPVALIVANALMLTTSEPWIGNAIGGTLLAVVAVSAEKSTKTALGVFRFYPLVFLGTISYSLYIWQQIFKYSYDGGFPALGAVALSILVATLSYYHIELPSKQAILLAWRQRSTRPKMSE